jgi:signal transduction histidine kinase
MNLRADSDTSPVATFELPLLDRHEGTRKPAEQEPHDSLPGTLLVRNIRWICWLRWLVTAVLVTVGVLAWLPALAGWLNMRERIIWPFVLAGILTIENIAFLIHYRHLAGSSPHEARLSLWGQIVMDLLVLTGVVHYTGSMETYVHFAYLFHIVLACIFFPRRSSLVVTVIACVLYGTCVVLEEAGVLPPAFIFAGNSFRESIELTLGLKTLNFLSTLGMLLVVWYLASRLSAMVRRRDRELDVMNQRLVRAREERMRHMLRTTHELKAPFAAIQANTQLLLNGYCGGFGDDVRQVVRKISTRSQRLAHEIQEMLQLANLRSQGQRPPDRTTFDLAAVVRWCIGQVRPSAEERNIRLSESIEPVRTTCVEEHLKMLFANLLSNAVAYSYENGLVRITCRRGPQGRGVVTIEDHGMGIEPEKLPRIFDEYYRTTEAARHNKESSGLGLAIVRHIVQRHALGLRVQSRVGKGTKFEVTLPAAGTVPVTPAGIEEPGYGLHPDS